MQLYTVKAGPLKIRLPMSGYGLCALGIIALGCGIRLALLSLGWPHTTIDEGTIGQMAMNIAFHGERPVFFYGQGYMGALQAYLGAVFFRLFGASLFSLRLGTVLLDTLFLASMYALARLLYPPKMALLSLLLLAAPALMVYYREIQAIGGYPESLLFGSLLFVLASWLALTARQEHLRTSRRLCLLRLLAFAGWGMVVGLGLWSDLLVLPFVFFSGLLLLVICWRDLLSLAPLCLLLGFIIGGLPLLIYNFQPGMHGNSLSTLLFLFHGGAGAPSGLMQRLLPHSVLSTFLVSLPTMTSYPQVCDVSSTLYLGGKGSEALRCAAMQGTWSLLWIGLWISATYLAIWALWSGRSIKNGRNMRNESERPADAVHFFAEEQGEPEENEGTRKGPPTATRSPLPLQPPTSTRVEAGVDGRRAAAPCGCLPAFTLRQDFVRSLERLTLLLAIALTVIFYAISPDAALSPYLNARYLLCILIGTPALIYPLWRAASVTRTVPGQWARKFGVGAARALLLALVLVFLLGTIRTFADIPGAQAVNAQQKDLVQRLEQIGAVRIYSDFWSCDRITFQSLQRIRCSDLTANLQPVGDRYKPNGIIVRADPLSSYVFPVGTPQASAIAQRFKRTGKPYHYYTFDGYVVYQPV